MRRVFHLLFAILYATLSSGAPSLVHYCAHDKDIHLSSPGHEHEEMSCCEHEQQEEIAASCHSVPGSSQESQINEADDCCATSFVSLDYAKQESFFFTLAPVETSADFDFSNETGLQTATQKIGAKASKRGPPLYVWYQRLVLYA